MKKIKGVKGEMGINSVNYISYSFYTFKHLLYFFTRWTYAIDNMPQSFIHWLVFPLHLVEKNMI
jgi:hypothetical protein